MASPRAVRIKRLVWKTAKGLVVLGALLVLAAALAYKNVIPGGPWLVDNAELLKNEWRLFTFEREADDVPAGAVVFVGSSSIAAYPLELYFRGAPWVDRGLPVETAKELAERFERTMPVARPAGVVVWTGMNDLRSDDQPPPVVIERVGRVLDMVAARYPDVPVVLLEIPPQCDTKPQYLEQLHGVNAKLAELAKARGMTFLKTDRPPLVTPEGQLSPAMAARDRKHLNLAGYGVLSKWLVEEGGPATAPLLPR